MEDITSGFRKRERRCGKFHRARFAAHDAFGNELTLTPRFPQIRQAATQKIAFVTPRTFHEMHAKRSKMVPLLLVAYIIGKQHGEFARHLRMLGKRAREQTWASGVEHDKV